MNRLKELRKQKGDTLESLSSNLKKEYNLSLSTGQLSSYENGKRSPRDNSTWEQLAKYFDVSISYLLGFDSNNKDIVKGFTDSEYNQILEIFPNVDKQNRKEIINFIEFKLSNSKEDDEEIKKLLEHFKRFSRNIEEELSIKEELLKKLDEYSENSVLMLGAKKDALNFVNEFFIDTNKWENKYYKKENKYKMYAIMVYLRKLIIKNEEK